MRVWRKTSSWAARLVCSSGSRWQIVDSTFWKLDQWAFGHGGQLVIVWARKKNPPGPGQRALLAIACQCFTWAYFKLGYAQKTADPLCHHRHGRKPNKPLKKWHYIFPFKECVLHPSTLTTNMHKIYLHSNKRFRDQALSFGLPCCCLLCVGAGAFGQQKLAVLFCNDRCGSRGAELKCSSLFKMQPKAIRICSGKFPPSLSWHPALVEQSNRPFFCAFQQKGSWTLFVPLWRVASGGLQPSFLFTYSISSSSCHRCGLVGTGMWAAFLSFAIAVP